MPPPIASVGSVCESSYPGNCTPGSQASKVTIGMYVAVTITGMGIFQIKTTVLILPGWKVDA